MKKYKNEAHRRIYIITYILIVLIHLPILSPHGTHSKAKKTREIENLFQTNLHLLLRIHMLIYINHNPPGRMRFVESRANCVTQFTHIPLVRVDI